MKTLQILATLWFMGFPITIILCVYRYIPMPGTVDSNVRAEDVTAHPTIKKVNFSAPDCSLEKIEEVKKPASKSAPEVTIDCNLNLDQNDIVTKKLVFEGAKSTGVTVNCNGATLNTGKGRVIEIRSLKYRGAESNKWRWERPEDITIRNCKMVGAVRIWGMAETGEGNVSDSETNHLKESSRKDGHITRVRNNAPSNIVFENVEISSINRIPLYLSPGVTEFQLLNSELKGTSSSVAIYLDTESGRNTFKNNRIYTKTTRELIAVDGSGNNRIISNWFSSLSHGGIYLYRNCGEGGVSRHSTPSNNQIINNVFVYKKYKGFNPAVYVGSRNGKRNYCDADDDSRFGSGESNLDHAKHNVIMQNQIYERSINDMIRVMNPEVNGPNHIGQNETVSTEEKRRAGCFISIGKERRFILHNESFNLQNGQDKLTCNDGDLVRSSL